jgi:hypothetical protein
VVRSFWAYLVISVMGFEILKLRAQRWLLFTATYYGKRAYTTEHHHHTAGISVMYKAGHSSSLLTLLPQRRKELLTTSLAFGCVESLVMHFPTLIPFVIAIIVLLFSNLVAPGQLSPGGEATETTPNLIDLIQEESAESQRLACRLYRNTSRVCRLHGNACRGVQGAGVTFRHCYLSGMIALLHSEALSNGYFGGDDPREPYKGLPGQTAGLNYAAALRDLVESENRNYGPRERQTWMQTRCRQFLAGGDD